MSTGGDEEEGDGGGEEATPSGGLPRRPRGTRVAALLLAAGEGTRFAGGPKMLAEFRGRPLLAWAVDPALQAGLPVVVVRGGVDLSSALAGFGGAVTLVDNPRWKEGQASSLLAGIGWCQAAGFDAAVVGLGDQPLVPSPAWRVVADAELAPIVSASFRGRRRPPVRVDRSVWPLLSDAGDEGARELMRRRPDLVAEVACEGDPMDVDTVEELRAQERRQDADTPSGNAATPRGNGTTWGNGTR